MRNEFKEFDKQFKTMDRMFNVVFWLACLFIAAVFCATIYLIFNPMAIKANVTPDGNGGYNFEVKPSY